MSNKVYHFRGNGSKMNVYSDKTFKTLNKVKKSRVDTITLRLSRSKLELMQEMVGKKSTKEELLLAYINQTLK